MKRKEYIYTLASSPLPKSVIDKQIPPVDEPEYITPYENAVLKWFKGNEAYFDKKYWINDKLNTESTNIRQEQKIAIKWISDTVESQLWEVKNTVNIIQTDILKNSDEIEREKELSNKRINATNEKVDKVKISVNETIQKIQTQIRQSDTDLQDKVSIINGDIRSNTRAIIETKNISISKAEKEHKHSIEDIDRLQSTIDAINDNIDDRTTIGEVKETLKEFYTKQETYSKKEINAKLDNIKPSVSTIIQWGWASAWPQVVTNAEKTALIPTLWMMVYTTDAPEGLYVYTSDWRQLLTTP